MFSARKQSNTNIQPLDQAILDVRTQAEWDSGHLPGATFAMNLGAYDGDSDTAMPSDLAGCEECAIVVYCGKYQERVRSG